MDAMQVAQRYFEAWNRRDASAVLATFAPDDTYSDPAGGERLSAGALAQYVNALWAAFPDLAFEIVSSGRIADDVIAAQWIMRGTNRGPFRGLPPTGRAVEVPGADFIRVDGDAIRHVQGYFDSRAVPEQLGLQVIVQPATAGPFEFGTSVAVSSGRTTRPGAFSITALRVRSEDEANAVRETSRRLGTEMLAMQGFIGWLGVTVGRRMITVSAWDAPEDAARMAKAPLHRDAVQRFFGREVAESGWTSVWKPERINPHWTRCPACSRMNAADAATAAACACGAPLAEPMPFW